MVSHDEGDCTDGPPWLREMVTSVGAAVRTEAGGGNRPMTTIYT